MIRDIRDFNQPLQPIEKAQVIESVVEPIKVVKKVKPKLKKENELIEEPIKEIEELKKDNEVLVNFEKDKNAILENKIKELEEEKNSKESEKKMKKIKKKFRVPLAFKRLSKKASKSPEYIFVQYLSLKKEVSYKVCRVVSGDIVVINNKAHVVNPEAVWKYKKVLFYIIREMDREPVSNLDYEKVKERKDDTQADVPLIKAFLGATNKNSNPLGDKNIIIWVILGALALGAVVIFSGGGA